MSLPPMMRPEWRMFWSGGSRPLDETELNSRDLSVTVAGNGIYEHLNLMWWSSWAVLVLYVVTTGYI